jgi:hypothetical protein
MAEVSNAYTRVIAEDVIKTVADRLIAEFQFLFASSAPPPSSQTEVEILMLASDLLETDFVRNWFDSASVILMCKKIDTSAGAQRWVFGLLQSIFSVLSVKHGIDQVTAVFEGLIVNRQLFPRAASPEYAGLSTQVAQALSPVPGSMDAFIQRNPWYTVLIGSISVVQADVRYPAVRALIAEKALSFKS